MNKKYKNQWYAVKCIFHHKGKKTGYRQIYEERIVLVKSNSFYNAINKAEKDARNYAKECDKCSFAGYLNAFRLFDKHINDMTEMFSDMRESKLSPKKYKDRYYPDLLNNCENHGLKHRWYNKDNIFSACYHCKVIKKGKLWEK